MIKTYIFDIDDTLYLERDYVKSGFGAVGEAVNCPLFGEKCWAMFEAGVRGNTFDLAKAEYPEIVQDTRELVNIYRCHYPKISLCPDAKQYIYKLRGRTGVISDGPVDSQRAKFRALGLLPWIECPIFTQECCASKPAPASFQLAAYTLNTPYEECVYIADNPKKDFAGPKSLGMKTIRIRRPLSLHYDEPSTADVDEEYESFEAMM